MRTEVATIQQMLTPEAAAVLSRSIDEAAHRRHSQTTPLHVATNLLAAPSGLLRRACAVSHPLLSSSSHPLHCRALELCFSVALDRLPAGPAALDCPDGDQSPPLSNALVAAVKRAQAHQRRGCADQQQPPLLAVKVELGQLVVSILDDPSVSRVMREASFSSPAVKAAIEQALSSSSSNPGGAAPTSPSSPAGRNAYISPRLQQEAKRREEIKKVFEIMTRPKKRNPVLVGDSDAVFVMKQVLMMIEKEELGTETPAMLRLAQVVSLEKEFVSLERSLIPRKINELYGVLERKVRAFSLNSGIGGLILDLGDLKWIVESASGFGGSPSQQQQQIGRAAVTEMGRLLARLREGNGNGNRVWVVGTATCATYLRCQVYHPTLEVEWDIQALPIAPQSPPPLTGFFPRSGGNGSSGSSIMAAAPPKLSPATDTTVGLSLSRSPETAFCRLCKEGYQIELDKLVNDESESQSSSETREDSKATLPQWLQIAIPSKKTIADQLQKKRADELLQKWRSICARLHMHPHATVITSERCSRALPHQFAGCISTNRNGGDLNLMLNSVEHQSSPVKTDLALGLSPPSKDSFDDREITPIAGTVDADSTKRLSKGLTEAVSWQPEAASAIAAAVRRCRSGNGKKRGVGAKTDLWLLFSGPDKVGKRKMAAALSDLVFAAAPTTINLVSPSTDGNDSDAGFRGRTLLDRIADAVHQNPFSVIVLEDIDHADTLVRGAIKRAIGSGRLVDSRGREVILASIIFILISDWWPDNLGEDKILDSAISGWQLELSLSEKTTKRRPDWLTKDGTPPLKQRNRSPNQELSLDLNLSANLDDDNAEEGSWNSSDLTVEHEHNKHGLLATDSCPTSSTASELIEMVDAAITFKPVDFDDLRKKVACSISSKFAMIMGGRGSIQIDEDALDRIVSGLWQSGAATVLDEWTDSVLVPSMSQLTSNLACSGGADRSIVRLSSVKVSDRPEKDWFTRSISIAIDGA